MSPAPPNPPAPAAKGNLSKWLAGHKPEAALGAAGIVVTIYLAYRSRQNSASSANTSATSSPSAALPLSYYPPTSGGGPGDMTGMDSILSALSGQLGKAGQTSPFSLPGSESFIGSGYGFGPSDSPAGLSTSPATSVSGVLYAPIEQQQVGALTSGGTTVYYQPAPGVFDPIPAGAGYGNLQGLIGNTPLFVKQQ